MLTLSFWAKDAIATWSKHENRVEENMKQNLSELKQFAVVETQLSADHKICASRFARSCGSQLTATPLHIG